MECESIAKCWRMLVDTDDYFVLMKSKQHVREYIRSNFSITRIKSSCDIAYVHIQYHYCACKLSFCNSSDWWQRRRLHNTFICLTFYRHIIHIFHQPNNKFQHKFIHCGVARVKARKYNVQIRHSSDRNGSFWMKETYTYFVWPQSSIIFVRWWSRTNPMSSLTMWNASRLLIVLLSINKHTLKYLLSWISAPFIQFKLILWKFNVEQTDFMV